MESTQDSQVNANVNLVNRLEPPPPSSPAAQDYTGCQTCRELHIGCDRELPICGPCRKRGRNCRRTGLKVRLTRGKGFSFARAKWVRIPKRISFLDETKEVIREALNEDGELGPAVDVADAGSPISICSLDSEPRPAPTARRKPLGHSSGPSPRRAHSVFSDPGIASLQASRASQQHTTTWHTNPRQRMAFSPQPTPLPSERGTEESPTLAPGSPTDRFIIQDYGPQDDQDGEPEAWRSQISSAQPAWPLEDPEEAMLFRHYVRSLANWLDLCDPCRSFETVVPARAGTCRMLLNAILAFAARHKTNTKAGNYDELAHKYHEESVRSVLAMGSRPEGKMDEDMFAANIILRVVQEIEVTNIGIDPKLYLNAFSNTLRESPYIVPGSVTAACFWVNLRQQIYPAVMDSHPVDIHLVPSLVDRSLEEADEYTWANRAVVHCADVINFCFDPLQALSPARWEELDSWNKMWQKNLPGSCHPIYLRDWEGVPGTFPQIWYHNSCHVIGAQHHSLATLLLLRHDPNLPATGGVRRMAEIRREQRVRQLVREMCAIGVDNHWTAPGMFTSCMAIAAFGDSFQDSRDQEAMLEILERTERDHARPTKAVQHRMMEAWGRQASDQSPRSRSRAAR